MQKSSTRCPLQIDIRNSKLNVILELVKIFSSLNKKTEFTGKPTEVLYIYKVFPRKVHSPTW
jgi:hypothetical protein